MQPRVAFGQVLRLGHRSFAARQAANVDAARAPETIGGHALEVRPIAVDGAVKEHQPGLPASTDRHRQTQDTGHRTDTHTLQRAPAAARLYATVGDGDKICAPTPPQAQETFYRTPLLNRLTTNAQHTLVFE